MSYFRTVIFDCDSTLSALEGIEELAGGKRAEVAALTGAAMRGEVPLEKIYGRRLQLIRPTRQAVEALTKSYIQRLVADAEQAVRTLGAAGVEVRIISGGLLPAVAGLAEHLGLAPDAVSAVGIRFDEEGGYAGFDEAAPAARAHGKTEVVRRWKEEGLPGPILLVGDGATDLEARSEVDLFVAYAGVIERPEVVEAAPIVIRSASLAPVLPLALGDARPEDAAGGRLYDLGKDLIDQGQVEWR